MLSSTSTALLLFLFLASAVIVCAVLLQVVGMGLLLTFIGMQTSKIVVPDKETMVRLLAAVVVD